MTRFRRKRDKFHAPDVLYSPSQIKSVNVLEDPDQPTQNVIFQVLVEPEPGEERYLHLVMPKGLAMTMLVRGADCLRVDIGLGPAGNYTRWSGAYGDSST